jgi:hypothetical protein
VLEAVTRAALALAALALVGCATGSSTAATGSPGAGPDGGTPDGGDPDGGNPDGGTPDGGSPDGGSPDGGMPVGDSLPPSAVSFFQGSACPAGWVPYTLGDGFFLVPTVATAPGGLPHGSALASGEDRTHTHGIAASFPLGSTSYVGISGGGNGGVGPDSTVMLSTTSAAASTGLPYIQLLVCRKNAAAVPGSAPLPHGLQMFFDMAACPIGWIQTATTQGRLIVGLPQGAPQDVTFGGPSLSSSADAGVDVRTHAHAVTATLATTSQGIALASGCCAGGYASNGTYTAMVDSSQDETGLPYLELLACENP